MLSGQPCFEESTLAHFHFQAEPNFEAIHQSLLKSCSSFLVNLRNGSSKKFRTFESTGMVTRGLMNLRSGKVQNLKMSTGTQG